MLPILKIFSLLLVHQCVMCQVCNETKSVYREVPETYRFSYIETYEEPCVIFCSVKTRKSVNVTTRMVQKFENITVNVCCDGYVEDNTHEGNGLYCKPVCNPPCTNGYCRKPNQCACEAGYALDPLEPHVCKPLCLDGCQIRDCISTKTPQCFTNITSEIYSTSQSPSCAKPCINAKCVGADSCQCLPGFHKTSPYNCEPTSYSAVESCKHGTLKDPFTCLCDEGWQWKCGLCQPVCGECDHGTCVSPGQCKCLDGYTMVEGKCEPFCLDNCAHGRCVSPDHCSCDPGWYKTTTGECKAHCDMSCQHGRCIAPNICECEAGYQLYFDQEISSCIPNSKDCENPKLEECKCEAPYEIIYFTENGSDCDCIGSCINATRKCAKAICLYMDVPFDMNPPESDYDSNINSNPENKYSLEKKSDNKISPALEVNYTTEHNIEVITPPELDYDYNSDEEEDDDVQANMDRVNSTFPSTNINSSNENKNNETEQSFKSNLTKTLSEVNYHFDVNQESEDNPNIENTNDSRDDELEVAEEINELTTALNSNHDENKKRVFKILMYSITGVVLIGVLIVLILGFIVKRKCSKKHSLNSTDKNDDVVVHYTSKIA